MTQIPPPQRSDQPAWQLDYASPMFGRPVGGVGFAGQLALGVATFLVAGVAGLLLGILVGSGTDIPTLGVLFGGICAIALLVYLATIARNRWRWTGFHLGILIGLGGVLLVAGSCFVALFLTK